MTTSEITFVGRQTEINCFQEIVESTSSNSQVLYLQGEGGIGKSRLLDQFQAFCSKYEFPFTQIIDLYDKRQDHPGKRPPVLENTTRRLMQMS